MASTPHHRFRTTLTGRVPPRAPRVKSHHRAQAPTRPARKALERLWQRLPSSITQDLGSAKTIERVAGRAWVYVKFMQKAAWARGMWVEEYGGMEGKAAGGGR